MAYLQAFIPLARIVRYIGTAHLAAISAFPAIDEHDVQRARAPTSQHYQGSPAGLDELSRYLMKQVTRDY
jgi:hypothetical protein